MDWEKGFSFWLVSYRTMCLLGGRLCIVVVNIAFFIDSFLVELWEGVKYGIFIVDLVALLGRSF